jgi:hypothetical protein
MSRLLTTEEIRRATDAEIRGWLTELPKLYDLVRAEAIRRRIPVGQPEPPIGQPEPPIGDGHGL